MNQPVQTVLYLAGAPMWAHIYGILNGMKALGIRVFTVGTRVQGNAFYESIQSALAQHEPGFAYDLTCDPDAHIDQILERMGGEPDLILYMENGAPLLPRGLTSVRFPTVGVVTEDFSHGDWEPDLFPYFDLSLSACHQTVVRYRGEGHDNLRYWYLGGVDSYHRDHGLPSIHDVCLLGGLSPIHRQRAKTVSRILRLREEGVNILTRYGVYFDEYGRTYSQTKIAVNRSPIDQLNMRVMEAAACGALVITNRPRDPDDPSSGFFTDREDVVYYDSDDEAVELVRYYLRNSKERERIAAAGKRTVLSNHTYRHVVQRLLELVPEAIEPRFFQDRQARLRRWSIDEHRELLDYGKYFYLHLRPDISHGLYGLAAQAGEGSAAYLGMGLSAALAGNLQAAYRRLDEAARTARTNSELILARANECIVRAHDQARMAEISSAYEEALVAIGRGESAPETLRDWLYYPLSYDRFRIDVSGAFFRIPSIPDRWRRLKELARYRLHSQVGLAAARRGAFDMAVTCLSEAARIVPDDGELLYDLGRAHLMCGDYPVALSCIEAASREAPFHPYAHRLLACLQGRLSGQQRPDTKAEAKEERTRGGISAIVHASNEEAVLEDALRSLKWWVDEIIVCDAGDGGRTAEIAARHAAKVVHHGQSREHGSACNAAAGAADREWVLLLDADERMTPELAVTIRELVDAGAADFDAMTVPVDDGRISERTHSAQASSQRSPRLLRRECFSFSRQAGTAPILNGKLVNLTTRDKNLAIVRRQDERGQTDERRPLVAEARDRTRRDASQAGGKVPQGVDESSKGVGEVATGVAQSEGQGKSDGLLNGRPSSRQRFSLYHVDGNDEAHRRWMAPYADTFKNRRHVLDLGCGPGTFLELLRERGVRGTGLDFDPDMVAICRGKGLGAEVGDIRKLSLDGRSFDGIHLGHVIEHMDGPAMIGLLEACLQALEPGGLLLIRTPNWSNEAVRNGGFWLDHTHVRPYPLELLERILQDLGLAVTEKGHEPQGWQDTYIVAQKLSTRESRGADASSRQSNRNAIAIAWEGPQFAHHSLALVNREICQALLGRGHELSILPREADQIEAEADPGFAELRRRVGSHLSRAADVHVRHAWPPDFQPPRDGRWVMMQPWEFGSIPKLWIERMQDQVDEVWAYTSFVKQCYVDSGMPEERVHVVPLGVDTARFRPGVAPRGLPTDKKFKFLFVGGTIARKGPDVLLSAYLSAFTRRDDVCLVIKDMGGESFYRGQTMAAQIRDLQANPAAPEILYLTDDLSSAEMPGLYAACDCLVHPYRGEGFGLPIAEAMACALPVIVTGAGAAMDFCDESVAYLIPARMEPVPTKGKAIGEWETVDQPFWYEPQRDALAQLMRHVFEHQLEARAKAERGARRIAERFTWERAAAAVEERLRVLASRPVRRLQEPASPPRKPISALLVESGDYTPFWNAALANTERPLRLVTVGGVEAPRLPSQWTLETAEEGPVVALNRLLEGSGDEPVLLISSDLVPTPGWLQKLLAALARDDRLAVVGPLSNQAPRPQRLTGKYDGTGKELRRFAEQRAKQHRGKVTEVPYLGGFCLVFNPRACRQAGLLSPEMDFGTALWDLFGRVRQNGFKVGLVHDCFVHHERLTDGEGRGFDDLATVEQAVHRHLSAGEAALAGGRAPDAIEEFTALVRQFPDLAIGHSALGSALMAANRRTEAVEAFRRAIELTPAESALHDQLGVALYHAGDLAGAEAAFLRARELDPEDVQALLNLIDLYRAQERYVEATQTIKDALRVDPDHPEVLVATGTVSLELGDLDGGRAALRRLGTISPDHPGCAALREAIAQAAADATQEAAPIGIG